MNTGPTPFLPPMFTTMPAVAFDAVIRQYGTRMSWLRSHACPCIYGNAGPGTLPIAGTPDSACTTCFGLGTYWDAPTDAFPGLITFKHLSPTPDEPGIFTNPHFGEIISAEPTVTVPYSDFMNPGTPVAAWMDGSTDDIFIEVDATARYSAFLTVGELQAVPFQQNLAIAASGAVTVYDAIHHVVVPVSGYTVNGPTVSIYGYDPGTNYQVEFTASPMYVVYRRAGGLPHVRPFGNGLQHMPKAFRAQTLDIWTRAKRAGIGYYASGAGNSIPYVMMTGRLTAL